jgi:tripartite-type tricarboxylate transporter receptor subunit TctC
MVSAGLAVQAQSFPAKPVRLISQFPPGGGTDVIARLLAPKLTESTGQPFVVENKPGAAGNIAAEYVARAPADGYTLLVANNTLVINAAMPQQLPFDVVKDFTPIALIVSLPVALAVHPSVQAKTVKELVDLVHSMPAKWNYSSCGSGTAMHLAGELFKQYAKLDMTHVPFKGCGPAIADGVGGHVPVLFNNISGLTAQAKGGRLRILALASANRSSVETSIPTMAEAGYPVEASVWIGFLAPAGTPPEVVEKLSAELIKAANAPGVRETMRSQLFDYRPLKLEQFAALIRSDVARWSKVIRDGNIRPN